MIGDVALMKTPQEWVSESITEYDPFEPRWSLTLKDIQIIQKDAFDAGRVEGLRQAVCIVSSRTMPPKKEAYMRAIEESVVFLKAEIDRGGKPAENITQPKDTPCSKNTP